MMLNRKVAIVAGVLGILALIAGITVLIVYLVVLRKNDDTDTLEGEAVQ